MQAFSFHYDFLIIILTNGHVLCDLKKKNEPGMVVTGQEYKNCKFEAFLSYIAVTSRSPWTTWWDLSQNKTNTNTTTAKNPQQILFSVINLTHYHWAKSRRLLAIICILQSLEHLCFLAHGPLPPFSKLKRLPLVLTSYHHLFLLSILMIFIGPVQIMQENLIISRSVDWQSSHLPQEFSFCCA